jgi:hypothetical protein
MSNDDVTILRKPVKQGKQLRNHLSFRLSLVWQMHAAVLGKGLEKVRQLLEVLHCRQNDQ